MRTAEEIFDLITDWENEHGEDFFDDFEPHVNEFNLAVWAFGKGYIAQEQLNELENANSNHVSVSTIIYGDKPYSIVYEPDFKTYKEGLIKAYKIVSEFFASSVIYQKRIEEFIDNRMQVSLQKALILFNNDKLHRPERIEIIMETLTGEEVIIRKENAKNLIDFNDLNTGKFFYRHIR